MECPRGCGTYSHLKHVTFLSDYDLRRESVQLTFDGECGHYWTVTFRQHEGQTYVKHSVALTSICPEFAVGLRDDHD
jgi:hypothetical protein